MKKTLATAMAVGAVVTIASNASAAAISSSAHDFNLTGWYSLDSAQTPYTDQICVPCHAPHGNQNLVNTLLWNHDTTAVATFTVYSSPTMDGTAAINAPTLQCMACHDGTVALEAFPQNGSANTTFIATGLRVGASGNFAQDHPIGVSYGAGDTELATTGIAYGNSTLNAYLIGGNVECATCHDPHNQGAPGAQALLVEGNTGSALCLKCHLK